MFLTYHGQRHGDGRHGEDGEVPRPQASAEEVRGDERQHDRGCGPRVLHPGGGACEETGDADAPGLPRLREAPEVPAREPDRQRQPGLDERRRRLPEHERLREEDRAGEEGDGASGDTVRGADDDGKCGEAEEEGRERALRFVPEQKAVEHEHLDREGLVRRPLPPELPQLMRGLEERGSGRVVGERVLRRHRCRGGEDGEHDIRTEERRERQLPAREGPQRGQTEAAHERDRAQEADTRSGGSREHERERVEPAHDAGGERDQRERDRTRSELVQPLEQAIVGAPAGAAEHERPGAEPRERRHGRERDVAGELRQCRGAARASAPRTAAHLPPATPGRASMRVGSRRQRRSLFDSMSNHIAKSVNWLPEIRSRATRTIVGVVISFPCSRRITSIAPRRRPANVITSPSA